MRTSNLTEREVCGIKIITQGQTQLAQVKKVITQTIVAKKREEVRDDLREAGDRARDRPGGQAEAPNVHLDGELLSFDPLRPMSVQQTEKNERNSPAGYPRLTGQHARKTKQTWCDTGDAATTPKP